MEMHGECDHCSVDSKVYLFWVGGDVLPLCQVCANEAVSTPVVKSYDA